MIFSVNKKKFESALNFVSKAINPKTPSNIFSYILIEAKDQDKIKVSATDIKFGITATVEADVIENGALAVPYKVFCPAVSLINDDLLTLNRSEDSESELLLMKSGNYECKIVTLPADEFPDIDSENTEPVFNITEKDLRNGVKFTEKSTASQEETKAVLTGIAVTLNKNKATFASTDGKRLSVCNIPVHYDSDEEKTFIIPRKALLEIARYVKDDDTMIYVKSNRSRIFFDMENTFVSSSLLEGAYPEYRQVIPQNMENSVVINRDEFISSLRFILNLSQDKDFPNLIRFEFFNNLIKIYSDTAELGSAFNEIPVEYQGEKIKIAFNGQFILNLLESVESEGVEFSFKDALSPAIFKPVNSGEVDPEYISVITPIRLSYME